jgi:hypothetical protein
MLAVLENINFLISITAVGYLIVSTLEIVFIKDFSYKEITKNQREIIELLKQLNNK